MSEEFRSKLLTEALAGTMTDIKRLRGLLEQVEACSENCLWCFVQSGRSHLRSCEAFTAQGFVK